MIEYEKCTNPKDGKPLLEEMLKASGGKENWDKIKKLEIHASMNGSIVQVKALKKMRARLWRPFHFSVSVRQPNKDVNFVPNPQNPQIEPLISIANFPETGYTGKFWPNLVTIDGPNGYYKYRKFPRKKFMGGLSGLRRLIKWDDLDFVYFLGYAVFNYYLTPYIFSFEDVQVQECDPIHGNLPPGFAKPSSEERYEWVASNQIKILSGKGYTTPPAEIKNLLRIYKEHPHPKLRVLQVTFPEYIPTHRPQQSFFVFPENTNQIWREDNLAHDVSFLIQSMFYSPNIGWLIQPTFIHNEMLYAHAKIVDKVVGAPKGAGKHLTVTMLRAAYMLENYTPFFLKWLAGKNLPGMYGELYRIAYFDQKGNDITKEFKIRKRENVGN